MLSWWNRLNKMDRILTCDLCLVMLLVSLFCDLGVMSPFTDKHNLSFLTAFIIVCINAIFLLLLFIIIINNINDKVNFQPNDCLQRVNRYNNLKSIIKNNPVVILLIVYSFIKLFYIDSMLRWDAAWYFCQLIKSVDNFNFTLSSIIRGFNWYGHPSMGYAFIISMGQFIDLGNHYILNLQNLMLSILAIVSFSRIITYLYCNQNKRETLLLTTCFAFNPLLFAVSLGCNIDFPLIVFFIASICALLYKRMIIYTFFAIILVFSKETGALLYFIFIISLLFFCRTKPNINVSGDTEYDPGQSLRSLLNSKASFLCLILPAVLFLLYLVYRKGKLWGGGSLGWNSLGLHTFGFNWDIFITRFSEMFILNFSWLPTLLILVFFIKIFFLQKNKFLYFNENRKNFLKILAIVYLGFILFNFFYITYNHPRYVLVSVFFLLLFSYHSLINIFQKENIRTVMLVIFVILSIIQTFKTVDPLSKVVFKSFNFGTHQMLGINPADGLVYNAEYTVIDKLLDMVNKEIKINENTNIILSEVGWVSHFNGAGAHTAININRFNLKRTFKTENSFQPKVYLIWDINKNNRPVESWYIYMSWFGNEKSELAHIQKYYDIIETKIINHHGYFFKLYKLKIRL